ncbi:hypothetical protein PIB30_091536 [Stylosanthes scabra]|uniref:Uncharacterized protein n=1 Tax=Stylosanthes scabra TaxID=79078 RepID=A0ABU6XVB0_9FABA|nr:hypothetical protein [Stylosanthes scabra]
MHRLRLHEVCFILFDSIPLVRSPLMVDVQVELVPKIGNEWMMYLDARWREEHRV